MTAVTLAAHDRALQVRVGVALAAIENISGLIRRYLSKGTDFSKVAPEQIARIDVHLGSLL